MGVRRLALGGIDYGIHSAPFEPASNSSLKTSERNTVDGTKIDAPRPPLRYFLSFLVSWEIIIIYVCGNENVHDFKSQSSLFPYGY